MTRETIIGRISIGPDGEQRIQPMVSQHAGEMLRYQEKVRALIEAAERFKADESGENVYALVEAARDL